MLTNVWGEAYPLRLTNVEARALAESQGRPYPTASASRLAVSAVSKGSWVVRRDGKIVGSWSGLRSTLGAWSWTARSGASGRSTPCTGPRTSNWALRSVGTLTVCAYRRYHLWSDIGLWERLLQAPGGLSAGAG